MIESKHTVTLLVGESNSLHDTDFECELHSAYEVLYTLAEMNEFTFDVHPFFSVVTPSNILRVVLEDFDFLEEAQEAEELLLVAVKKTFEDIYG